MLRMFIRAMHNRVGPRVESYDLRFGDLLVLAPLVAVILALALYPQLPIEKGEQDINGSIRSAQLADGIAEAEAGHAEIQVIR
jgi:NADH-quinone oxidoreductase subunit M